MAARLPREVLKWILSLDLSYPVRNAKRDFSNGFLVAEILSRYFPSEVQMHSFSNVSSVERKRSNWQILAKIFKKKDIILDEDAVTAIMSCEGEVVVQLLLTLYKLLPSIAYSSQAPDSQRSDTLLSDQFNSYSQQDPTIPDYTRRPEAAPFIGQPLPPVVVERSQAYYHQAVAGYPGSTTDSHHIPAYASLREQQLQIMNESDPERLINIVQQGCLHDMVQEPEGSYHPAASSAQQHGQYSPSQDIPASMQWGLPTTSNHPSAHTRRSQAENAEYAAAAGMCTSSHHGSTAASHHRPRENSKVDALAYSRKPRPVDYQPYSIKDYASKFDVKKQEGYWELGKLGPDLESQELQQKREKLQKLKQLGKFIHQTNQHAIASAKPKPKPPKEPSAREKALQFAKTVPKPEAKPTHPIGHDEAGVRGGPGGSGEQGVMLEELERKHNLHQAEVDRIRNDMMHLLRP